MQNARTHFERRIIGFTSYALSLIILRGCMAQSQRTFFCLVFFFSVWVGVVAATTDQKTE